MRRSPIGLLLVLWTCSGCAPSSGLPPADEEEEDPLAGRTLEGACGGEGKHNGDGSVTAIACDFEQQLENIAEFGEETDAQELVDANGVSIATVDTSCAAWWLGADANGTTVIINQSTGEVRSHGKAHPGQELSGLPEFVSVPLTVR